jgi:hypothetical protein
MRCPAFPVDFANELFQTNEPDLNFFAEVFKKEKIQEAVLYCIA